MNKNPTHFIVYKTVDQKIAGDVRIENGSIWISIEQMAKIFESNCNTIAGCTTICRLSLIGAYKLQQFGPAPSKIGSPQGNYALNSIYRPPLA